MCVAFRIIIWGSQTTGIGIEQTRVEKGYLFFSKCAVFFPGNWFQYTKNTYVHVKIFSI